MEYKEFLELIHKNNIKLFDHDKRISYYNIKKYKINNDQKGGGSIKYNNNFKNIIDISLSSNPHLLLSIIN